MEQAIKVKMGSRAKPDSKWSIYNIKKCSVCSKVLARGTFSGRCSSHRILSEESKLKQRQSVMKVMTSELNPMKRIEVRRKFQGENSHFWRGGISPKNKVIRRSFEYKEWREAVFSRDNWTCQECGRRDGSELHPHHIKAFSKYPKLRFEVNNGLTLCRGCHKLTDNYAAKANKI